MSVMEMLNTLFPSSFMYLYTENYAYEAIKAILSFIEITVEDLQTLVYPTIAEILVDECDDKNKRNAY